MVALLEDADWVVYRKRLANDAGAMLEPLATYREATGRFGRGVQAQLGLAGGRANNCRSFSARPMHV